MSTSTSTSTWLFHEYGYGYWLMSTSTGLWSTFHISSRIAFFSLWKRNLQIVIDLGQSSHCSCKFPLSIYICLTIHYNFLQWHFNLRIVTYWLSWLTITTCCQCKNRKQKLCNIMKCVETCLLYKVWSKNFHTLTRSWMGKWTWTNDNNKHKHHNSISVNF